MCDNRLMTEDDIDRLHERLIAWSIGEYTPHPVELLIFTRIEDILLYGEQSEEERDAHKRRTTEAITNGLRAGRHTLRASPESDQTITITGLSGPNDSVPFDEDEFVHVEMRGGRAFAVKPGHEDHELSPGVQAVTMKLTKEERT